MSVSSEDQDDDFGAGDDPNAASLTDLNISQRRSPLTIGSRPKAGDITDQLAQIRLPGEADLTVQPQASPPPAGRTPLRAVRDLDSVDEDAPPPPKPTLALREVEDVESLPDLPSGYGLTLSEILPENEILSDLDSDLDAGPLDVAASSPVVDMVHAEIQQELLGMLDHISSGFPEDDVEHFSPQYPDPEPSRVAPATASEGHDDGRPMPAPDSPPDSTPGPVLDPGHVTMSPEPDVSEPVVEPSAPLEPAAEEIFSKMPQGLVKYWMSLTNGRKYPSWSNFKQAKIAEYWPNTMVLTAGPADGRGNLTITKVTRIADQNVTPATGGSNRVEYTPMLTEWILSLGKDTAVSGKPMQESDRFPTNEGIVRYQIILLPLSEEQSRIDHVLCHVYRA